MMVSSRVKKCNWVYKIIFKKGKCMKQQSALQQSITLYICKKLNMELVWDLLRVKIVAVWVGNEFSGINIMST